uniref:Uncharacterized protein n=1 Tax=viral metagenome TaxID=1070528 RepID=A0A6C0C9G9_9ZZZZ
MRTILKLHPKTHPWTKLRGKKILNRNILFQGYKETDFDMNIIFPNATTVLFDSCSRNFADHWLDKVTFPEGRNVFIRFNESNLPDYNCEAIYRKFDDMKIVANQYWRTPPNVGKINPKQFDQMINSADGEELLWATLKKKDSQEYETNE